MPTAESNSSITQHEPAPIPNDERPIYELLIDFIRQRAEYGKKNYKTYLQAHNGRDALMDALQESIDLNQYLCQMAVEAKADRDSEHRWAEQYFREKQAAEKERDSALALARQAVEVLEGAGCHCMPERQCEVCAFLSRPEVKAMGGGE